MKRNLKKSLIGFTTLFIFFFFLVPNVEAIEPELISHSIQNSATEPKMNIHGDAIWIETGFNPTLYQNLIYYDRQTDSTSIVTTVSDIGTEQHRFVEYDLNDLGDVIWETRDDSNIYGNRRHSAYYKAYNSSSNTFLGRSVQNNLSTLPRINNNRMIVLKGILNTVSQGGYDLWYTFIGSPEILPVTVNLWNTSQNVGSVYLNDQNLIAYNVGRGVVRAPLSGGSWQTIWSGSNGFSVSNLANDGSFLTTDGYTLKQVICINTCSESILDTTTNGGLTALGTNDYGQALWQKTASGATQTLYNRDSITQSISEGTYKPIFATLGGDGQLIWTSNISGERLYWYDSNTQTNKLLTEAVNQYFVYPFTMNTDGDITIRLLEYSGGPANTYYIEKPVFNQAPTSNAGSDQTVNEGQSVSFDGSLSTDPDGVSDIVSYEWDFGDGATASGQTANHTYIQDGIYTATLTVTDSANEVDTDEVVITVNNLAPVINPLSAIDPTLPAQINIGTSFTDAGILDTHTATIDWGDSTVTTGTINELFGSGTVIGNHSYTTAGLYTITLTVTDGAYSSFVTTSVQILNPSEAINELVDLVETFNLQQGINNSLDAKLDAAISALDDMNENNDQAAINSLQSFINAVEAQRGDKITNEQADALIETAQAIINTLQ